jgi:ABC-type phosphate transport system permease subunit
VYSPSVAGTFGLALLVPVLPLYLDEIGRSLGLASVVLTLAGMMLVVVVRLVAVVGETSNRPPHHRRR